MSETFTAQSNKLTFSGHDTFHCRQLWLKKGYDFVKKGNKFMDSEAVVLLGVGKNMVSAIYFWMKAFGLIDKDGNTTDLADYIFSLEGKDPYLEDEATLWLLHYHLVTQGFASIYDLIFNDFRKEKIEFTKDNFLAFAERKALQFDFNHVRQSAMMTTANVMTGTQLPAMENYFVDEEIAMLRYPENFIIDIISSMQVSVVPANVVEKEQDTMEGNAALTAEGVLKPLVSFTFKNVTYSRKKYAGHIEYTEELELDFSRLFQKIISLFEDEVLRSWQNGVLADIIANYSSAIAQLYLLDFGSETLKAFRKSKHVGDVMFSSDNARLVGIFVLFIAVLVVIIVWPFCIIFALNTLFITLSIPYTFWTWLSVLILTLVSSGKK